MYPPFGAVASGQIAGVQITSGADVYHPLVSGQIASGAIGSGAVNSGSNIPTYHCPRCDRELYPYASGFQHVLVGGLPGAWPIAWCCSCAGYDQAKGGFETREDWIRDTVPLPDDTPAGVIADWLRDQSRYKDADYMLTLHQEDMHNRMSGG